MIATKQERQTERATYVYTGGDQWFSDQDAPGTILTLLNREDLSHLENQGSTIHLVIDINGKQSRMSFMKSSFDKFKVLLRDKSKADLSDLDEHITLDECIGQRRVVGPKQHER